MFTYTVKSGDSLYKISKVYNTTVDELKKLNNLTSNALSIGQNLRIPETYTKEDEMTMPVFTNYTVKSGDNLYSIARKYNTTVDEIIKDNGLKSNNLSIGQNLKIKTTIEEIEECIGPDYTPPESDKEVTYTVKAGDSLYKIANNYNTSVSNIISLNNLKSNNLSIGQVLKIPKSSSDTSKSYTVIKGDSLYSIARKLGTTVDSIKKKNNLKSNALSIGQILKI